MNQTVDLTNCDREPIHLIGSIQPLGFLLALSPDWVVQHASVNVATWLGVEADAMLGQPLSRFIDAETLHTIRGRLQLAIMNESVERIFRLRLTTDGSSMDIAVHLAGQGVIIEAEPSEPAGDIDTGSMVCAMMERVRRTPDVAACCREAARQVRALTGFDRVMVYRFDADGAGEVIAESLMRGVPSYLGLRYPASDIPVQARALYERNWLRCIADIDAEPAAIVPQASVEGIPLDLSRSVLRSVSPIHCEYLRNMGVAASLSVSVLRQGRLWGLIACHNLTPRHIALERRSAAELFGQMFSLVLESREREREAGYEAEARRLHHRMLALMADNAPPLQNILTLREEMTRFVASDGFAVSLGGEMVLEGQTPTPEEVQGLLKLLNRASASAVFATNEIGRHYLPGRDFTMRAAGMLAIPLSRQPRDYIIFFRKEVVRTVSWAGNPDKPVEVGPNGARLTPRKSFEAWQQEVQGQSNRWSEIDLRIAESLRITLLEVVLRLADVAEAERRLAQERQELLIAELNHRVRNILGLVRALVTQSQGGVHSVEEFAKVVGGRLQALARAHDQITAEHWKPAPLRAILDAEFAAYLNTKTSRIQSTGPEVLLSPHAYPVVALVIHELVTNSAKYGAFADTTGRLAVDWSLDGTGHLVLTWAESGGPPVQAPSRQGFGTTIIARSIPHDLKGEADISFVLSGLRARFVIPAVHVTLAPTAASVTDLPAPDDEVAAPSLRGPVLLLEDNMIIAMSAEDILHQLGVEQVDVVASVGQALRAIEAEMPAVGMLDVHLGTESSFPVAERLRALGVPFLFATGYGETAKFPEEFRNVTVLRKPYDSDQLGRALAELVGQQALSE